MGWTNVAQVGGALVGAWSSRKNAKDAAKAGSKQGQLDPRVDSMLFGDGEADKGLLSQYRDLLNQPQSDASKNFGTANSGYINNYAGADLDASRYAAYRAMQGNQAPQVGAAQSATGGMPINAYAVGNQIQAPKQNDIDLSGTFGSLLGGGNTSALMNSLQAGNALTNQQLQQNQASLTQNLQKNVLPSIRGGAIAAGQYGGSRQGIAEGNAISDFTKQLNDSTTQIGLANSANNASQLAGAYESGQGRALAAAQGLSGQQYATAAQNAATKNQAEFMNVGNQFDASKTNAGIWQQNNQFNAGLQQQAGLANQQSQLATNAQNNSSNLAGAGLLSGLLGQANSNVNANDNWGLDRAKGVNSLLQPYLTSSPTQNPMTSNSAGSAIGGGLMGLQLGSQLGGLFGGGGSGATSLQTTGSAGQLFQPGGMSMPTQSIPYSW